MALLIYLIHVFSAQAIRENRLVFDAGVAGLLTTNHRRRVPLTGLGVDGPDERADKQHTAR